MKNVTSNVASANNCNCNCNCNCNTCEFKPIFEVCIHESYMLETN